MSRPDAILEVWPGHDNIEELVVVVASIPITNLDDITKIEFVVGDTVIASDEAGSGTIWWNDTVQDKVLSDGSTFSGNVVRCRLGRATIEPGAYKNCRIVVYSEDYPNGRVISDNLTVIVWEADSG